MKLKRKFTIIVTVTIVQILLLVVVILKNSSKMQKMKNYQYIQSTVEVDLGDTLNLLNQVDFWGIEIDDVYDDFTNNIEALNDKYAFVLTDHILKSFSDDFVNTLGEQSMIWSVFRTKFSTISSALKDLQNISFSSNAIAVIKSDGIRVAANKYPDDKNLKKAIDIVNKIHGQMEGILRSGKRLSNLNAECAIVISEVIEKEEHKSLLFSLILSIVACVFMAFLILLVTRGIVVRMQKIRDMTSVLASKDFTVSIKPEGCDEMRSLMENINNMVNQINDFFIVVKTTAAKAITSGYTINDSANSSSAAAAEIDENIGKINKEFEEITKSIQFTIEAITDMNNHVEVLVENNSRQTSAIDASNKAVNGAATTLEYINQMAMQRTKSAEEMHELVADGDSKINQTSKVLNDVTGQLDKVRAIVTIINKVAAKTNLLSMNAAIEAAHAGESGKGFGVVAGEIRALAEETTKNAVLIEGVVKTIVNAVSEANSSSAAASTAFVRVRDHADQIISSLQEITEGVGSIDSQMHQIKETSEETACAADEINTYCTNLALLQKEVSAKVDSMNSLFLTTKASTYQIKQETVDIVNRVSEVSNSSNESYKNMTDLENVLDEFKTKTSVEDFIIESKGEIVLPDNSIEKVMDHSNDIEILDEPVDDVDDLQELYDLNKPASNNNVETEDFDFDLAAEAELELIEEDDEENQ